MKKLIVEVDEDYLNELCEAFKKKPIGGIPAHRAWALLEGLKNGTPLDGLTNGEVFMKMFPQIKKGDTFDDGGGLYLHLGKREFMAVPLSWWNAKWEDK